MFIWIFGVLLIFCSSQLTQSKDISCRDENGDPIDWFYLYKLPRHFKSKNSIHPNDETGLRYLYITPENINWTFSEKLINQNESLPGQTIQTILNYNQQEIIIIAYNDETPNGTVNFQNGHTKGVLVANLNSGFWLIHSVPKYPDFTTTTYSYPSNGLHYGQSFLCISLTNNSINDIGEQLIIYEPNVYYHTKNIEKIIYEKYPNLQKVIEKEWKQLPPFYNEIQLKSVDGTEFIAFGKGKRYLKELYEDYVAPQLKVNLYVETWRLGPGNLPSNCSQSFHVMNIKEIHLDNFEIQFNTTADHSKWCVGVEKPLICVGDINRQQHQLLRGGGTVCQSTNFNLAEAYRQLITTFEGCPKYNLF